LYFAAATNFVNYKDVSADQHQRVDDVLTKLGQRTYQEILESAVTDYQQYFNRVKLELPVTSNSFLPTTERIQKIQSEPDPSLAALSYQFGRYLMIGSSRPGTRTS
jgi:alpha-L-fucosidase 2